MAFEWKRGIVRSGIELGVPKHWRERNLAEHRTIAVEETDQIWAWFRRRGPLVEWHSVEREKIECPASLIQNATDDEKLTTNWRRRWRRRAAAAPTIDNRVHDV